jgi:hypothetical protein
MQSFEVAANPGDLEGAIWMGGASPVIDGSGNIFLATGNSAFVSSTDPYDNSDGVLELNPSTLALEQSFTPGTWYADNASDLDLGSSSPALLSGGLVFQAGKSQHAYVLSASSLGGVGGQLATANNYCGSVVDGGSAVQGDTVYTPCALGVVKTQVTPGSPPTVTSVWRTATGSPGPPVIAGGLVWTINHNNGTLYGLDPTAGTASQSFSIGSVANHFPTPSVADGLLLAPSSNQVHAFDGPAGLPPSPTGPPTPTPLPYIPVANPTRICDTRGAGPGIAPNQCNGQGAGGETLGADGLLPITVPNLPAGASAAVLNVTVTDTSASSILTVWPAGEARPGTSNLNWAPGTTTANLVEVGVGTGGQVDLSNLAGSADVIVDLEGYVAPVGTAGTGLFTPLSPGRICDTRAAGPGVAANPCDGNGTGAGTLGTGGTRDVQVTGAGGVPASGVAAVVLNVTVADTTAGSYLTVWPTGATRPTASNLNWTPGLVVPNRVIVPVGNGGKVSLYNLNGAADAVVDVAGWFTDSSSGSATGAEFVALSPGRLCDTRAAGPGIGANQCNGNGTGVGTLGAGGTRSVQVAGQGGIPASGVVAVVANVTVTDTTAPSYLTVWPHLTARPTASDLNWNTGVTVPNLVVAKLGTDGALDTYNLMGSTDVVMDLAGYYTG